MDRIVAEVTGRDDVIYSDPYNGTVFGGLGN